PEPRNIRTRRPFPACCSSVPRRCGTRRYPEAGVSEFLIITGLSGAGRSQASDTFEDLGCFVIDNLPPTLIAKVAELVQAPGSTTERVALAVGTGAYLEELAPALDQLRQTGAHVRVLFLEASNEVLIRRYENTRR